MSKTFLAWGSSPNFWLIAGQAEHVAHPQRRGPEQVGLQGDAVAVAHHHLQQGVDPHLLEQHAAGDRAHPHHRGLVVGDVAGVDVALDIGRLLPHDLRIGAAGRTAFGRHGEMAGGEDLFQIASRFHQIISSLTMRRGPPSLEVFHPL